MIFLLLRYLKKKFFRFTFKSESIFQISFRLIIKEHGAIISLKQVKNLILFSL